MISMLLQDVNTFSKDVHYSKKIFDKYSTLEQSFR
jgi:hypothetical protein